MKQELFNFLTNFPMLTDDERQLIVDNSTIQNFKKGTLLLEEGQVAKNCYLVLKGCVRAFIIKDGEEKSTAFYTEGEPVNSFTSSTSGTKSDLNLICLEDCTLTIGDQALEEEMCRLIPRLESIIRQEVEKGTGQFQDTLTRFITSTPEERYQDLLSNRSELLNRVPQHLIASYIGVTPESLSRIRKRISKK